MEQHNFVAAGGERGEVFFQSADGAEQIGDEHEQSAFFYGAHDAMERGGEVRGGAFGGVLEFDHEMAQVAGSMQRRKLGADFLIKSKYAHGVHLEAHKINQR